MRARAFSLVEVLLATALLGALLLALNFFVFSMAEIWGAGAERRLFEQHVRAVTREVEGLFRRTALPPPAGETPVFVREIRLDDGRRVSPLAFELPAGYARLPWPERPLPDVVLSLVHQEGRGFLLYWQSRLEERFDEAAPRPFVLSPFGAGLAYEYREADGAYWRAYDQLQRLPSGAWSVPARLRLRFKHGAFSAETTVALPAPAGALPHF